MDGDEVIFESAREQVRELGNGKFGGRGELK
jgi:hypothetical protein